MEQDGINIPDSAFKQRNSFEGLVLDKFITLLGFSFLSRSPDVNEEIWDRDS